MTTVIEYLADAAHYIDEASRAEHWSQRGYREEVELAVPAVKFEDVQMFKGQPRRSFLVVDLGDYRVVVQ